MKEHTTRLLNSILSMLKQYREGRVDLSFLVRSLEGSLMAIEEELPQSFYDYWYEHWGELEMYLALDKEKEKRSEILEEVKFLESYIKPTIEG